MYKYLFGISLILIFSQCGERPDTYKEDIYWIDPDTILDKNDSFEICNPYQIFNSGNTFVLKNRAGYIGGNKAILKELRHYSPLPYNESDGILSFRFIINCNGEIGHIQAIETDFDYNSTTFPKKIKSHFATFFKTLDQWKPVTFRDKEKDVYYLISFKFQNGEVIDILP